MNSISSGQEWFVLALFSTYPEERLLEKQLSISISQMSSNIRSRYDLDEKMSFFFHILNHVMSLANLGPGSNETRVHVDNDTK